jgi:hydrophobic/amphiphilic exporter-1 (mainly G- bacteria), HAE1 family
LIANANAGHVITRLNSTLRANVPQLYVDIDRVKALSLGVPMDNVFNTLGTYLGSSFVNNFTLFGRNYRVLTEAENSFRTDKENIGQFEVRNNKGQMLPIKTFVTVKDIVGPQSVTHYNIYPSTTITGIALPPYSSGQAITEMQRLCKQTLPSDINYQWSGVSYQQITASTQTSKIFLIASIFAFLFLAAQYESWTIPFAIIFAVPIALLGAVLFTWTRGFENNIYTQIGIVLLIGLANKTSILLVEFAKTHHENGYSIFDSALEAARLRLRPVLMTAFAFILGVFPLVIASGAGAVSRRNMGTAVFGGMLIGTFMGLLMIPVFYVVIQKLTDKIKSRKSQKENVIDATSDIH